MEDSKANAASNGDKVCLFGIDIGTTAIKCAIVNQLSGCILAESSATIESCNAKGQDNFEELRKDILGEQYVEDILFAVRRAIFALPGEHRQKIASVGICGQMHGVVWWRCDAVNGKVERLFTKNSNAETVHPEEKSRVWSKLITWQDQRCSPSHLQVYRERSEHFGATPATSSPLATGYGLATYAYMIENSPDYVKGFDACGTIQDFVAFVICGHSSPAQACIDVTNACSWGGFNLQEGNWNTNTVQALGIPLELLPTVKKSGEIIGQTMAGSDGGLGGSFGLPHRKSVFVPMGDHPCSVVAAIAQENQLSSIGSNLTLVNIGTSAQLAMVLSRETVEKLGAHNSSFEIRPFLFDNYFIGVAAALSGGNVYAWFVKQFQEWINDFSDGMLSSQTTDADIYARLISLGMSKRSTDLVFLPTLNGERANPDVKGSIQQLCMINWSLGDISAALCRGLIDNLFQMVPEELRATLPKQSFIGTGNALVRNDLLQYFLESKLADPTQLRIQKAVDAAVGAALAPSLIKFHSRA